MWAVAKRVFLFALTNILVILTLQIALGVVFSLLGVPQAAFGNPAVASLMVWALVWGFGGALISLLMSRVSAKWMMGVQVIDPNTQNVRERELLQMVYRLADKAGLPRRPEVGFYEGAELNAFATGPSRSRSLVAVSTGLLNRMDTDQLEGVLGHEVSHIANGDMVTMTLIQGVVISFVLFFSRILSFVVGQQVEERMRFVVEMAVYIGLQILFGLLGSLVVNWFSQRREFRADAGGAKLAGQRKMISALQALAAVHPFQAEMPDEHPAMASLKISATGTRNLLGRLMSTHPPLEERIRRLQEIK